MTNWKRLIGWPWFGRVVAKEPMKTGWESDSGWGKLDPRQKNARLYLLTVERNKLIARLEIAKRARKARKHIYAALEANTRERLRIEGGV